MIIFFPLLAQARGMSIKMMPMSLVMEGGSGKSYLVNLMDCPGHVNFNDEVRGGPGLLIHTHHLLIHTPRDGGHAACGQSAACCGRPTTPAPIANTHAPPANTHPG